MTNGELNPVAIAFASIVLPVPGAPWKRMPRSRRPPANSNASPDCQRLTIRRTSSFASAWPRTSSSLTPQLASPGSKPLICEMPIIIIGPIRIRKLKMKKKGRMISWLKSAVFAEPVPEAGRRSSGGSPPGDVAAQDPLDEEDDRDEDREPQRRSGNQKRQNQWRRRLRTSSSRICSPSSANRLGCGMNLRKIRSSRPRNAKTATAVATIAQPSAMSCDFHSQMKAAGAESTATNVAERRSERHWSFSARSPPALRARAAGPHRPQSLILGSVDALSRPQS